MLYTPFNPIVKKREIRVSELPEENYPALAVPTVLS